MRNWLNERARSALIVRRLRVRFGEIGRIQFFVRDESERSSGKNAPRAARLCSGVGAALPLRVRATGRSSGAV